MDTEHSLWKHLAENPTDDSAKLALADLLTERGEEYTARALKWCVGRRKWPLEKQGSGSYWMWGSHKWGHPLGHYLPEEITRSIPLHYSYELNQLFVSLGEFFLRMDRLMNPNGAD